MKKLLLQKKPISSNISYTSFKEIDKNYDIFTGKLIETKNISKTQFTVIKQTLKKTKHYRCYCGICDKTIKKKQQYSVKKNCYIII